MSKPNLVGLDAAQREQLRAIIHKGTASARVINRANILLLADEGKHDDDIVAFLHTSLATIGRVRHNFVHDGLDTTLYDQPRTGRPRQITGEVEAHLVSIACSKPPTGFAHWSLQLLADKMVELHYVEHISATAVGYTLKKTSCSPTKSSSGAFLKRERSL